MKARKFGFDVAHAIPSVHTHHVSRCQMSSYFGGKAYGHPRLVKERQLSVLPKVLSLDSSRWLRLIVMSTNLEYKEREKENVGRQASEAQREKKLERERKSKGDIFCWRNNMKFCSGGEKMRMLAATRVKMSDSEKKK